MTDSQPKLLNQPNLKPQGGPVFDFGPGWGFYIKRWLGKYLFKIILPALVIIVAMGIYVSRNGTENGEKTMADNETVKIMVLRGDSRALLARKALAEYLKENSQEMLTGGQKLFIEEMLRRKLSIQKLTVGESVEFGIEDIATAIFQAKQLSSFQLQKWEMYAKGIKF